MEWSMNSKKKRKIVVVINTNTYFDHHHHHISKIDQRKVIVSKNIFQLANIFSIFQLFQSPPFFIPAIIAQTTTKKNWIKINWLLQKKTKLKKNWIKNSKSKKHNWTENTFSFHFWIINNDEWKKMKTIVFVCVCDQFLWSKQKKTIKSNQIQSNQFFFIPLGILFNFFSSDWFN